MLGGFMSIAPHWAGTGHNQAVGDSSVFQCRGQYDALTGRLHINLEGLWRQANGDAAGTNPPKIYLLERRLTQKSLGLLVTSSIHFPR